MLPTPELLATWYLAEMRIPVATFKLCNIPRQWTTELTAPMPPTFLLAATRLVAAELFH
jgi:hypothetical protein